MKNLLLVLTLFVTAQVVNAKNAPLPTVKNVSLEKYLGKWFEIARFDQKFQRGCTATTATYTLLKKNTVKVLNECRLDSPDGELKSAQGRAWIVDKETNAKLKVQFFLSAFKLPFLAGNYWILDLGENYEYALIGEPSREYLWILSRTEEMDQDLYDNLVEKAESLGFDTSKLLRTIH
jgi:apolipoprotein D and lipocalin family protein